MDVYYSYNHMNETNCVPSKHLPLDSFIRVAKANKMNDFSSLKHKLLSDKESVLYSRPNGTFKEVYKDKSSYDIIV